MSGKMVRTQCDTKGRIYLRESLRAKYGDRFVIVEMQDGLQLLPVPADPIRDLEELGKPLRGRSLAELRSAIAEQASQEAQT